MTKCLKRSSKTCWTRTSNSYRAFRSSVSGRRTRWLNFPTILRSCLCEGTSASIARMNLVSMSFLSSKGSLKSRRESKTTTYFREQPVDLKQWEACRRSTGLTWRSSCRRIRIKRMLIMSRMGDSFRQSITSRLRRQLNKYIISASWSLELEM